MSGFFPAILLAAAHAAETGTLSGAPRGVHATGNEVQHLKCLEAARPPHHHRVDMPFPRRWRCAAWAARCRRPLRSAASRTWNRRGSTESTLASFPHEGRRGGATTNDDGRPTTEYGRGLETAENPTDDDRRRPMNQRRATRADHCRRRPKTDTDGDRKRPTAADR